MAFSALPKSLDAVDTTQWATLQPYYDELIAQPPTPDSVDEWLHAWSQLARFGEEAFTRLYVAKTIDTKDKEAEQRFLTAIQNVSPQVQAAEQQLKELLLASGLEPTGAAMMMRNLRSEAALFRTENIPLKTELQELSNAYDNLTGPMSYDWDGEEKNLNELNALLQEKDQPTRERAWRAMMDLWLAQRPALNDLYTKMLPLRRQLAANVDMADFRAYSFEAHGRFDYTPDDCLAFHAAIEQVVVPAAGRILARRRERLELDVLRPWDVNVEAGSAPPLKPYRGQAELIDHCQQIFNHVDPELGGYFGAMIEHELLDLDTRPGKALGGYCASLSLQRRPFIFMNGTGIHEDVQTMLHECGHAFHEFEVEHDKPLIWHTEVPMEFSEVASMGMELLAAPYLTHEYGGFYTAEEAARAQIEHLEGILLFLPYMAVVDLFQHWVYTHPDEAADPANCDAQWDALYQRFMTGYDMTGFEDIRATGWHRKLHIFQAPFYYIEYGMAQVGALQVWRNSLRDRAGALRDYRRALAQGGRRPLPELFAAAGATFRFDSPLLSDLVALVESTVADLERQRA